MKRILKKWWILIIVLASIIGLMCFKVSNRGVGTAGISLEEFEKIELGMGETTVNKLIDTEDEWSDDKVYEKCCTEVNKNKDNHIYTYTYKYLGEKGGYALVTFEADYSKGNIFVLPTVSKK